MLNSIGHRAQSTEQRALDLELVTGVHLLNNPKQSRGQRAEGREQRAESRGQRAEGRENGAESLGHRAECKEQRKGIRDERFPNRSFVMPANIVFVGCSLRS